MESSDIDTLRRDLTGDLITKDHPQYDETRAVWNGMIDKHPAMIALCQNTEDVVTAINFARQKDIFVSVRGGGHNVAGSAVCDGGLVIDLSQMTDVTVDPVVKTVRVQGGATLADLDEETQRYGLAVPGGVVSETGVAGLTLGGGVGWLRRKFGLTCDNLIGATVVTSDGRVVHTNETENEDLLWGLRGGGGQFGIVTEFEFQAHSIGPDVMFVFVMHPGEDTKAALEFYREYIQDISDDVSSMAVLGHVPPVEDFPSEHHGKPFVMFGACYAGSPDDGKQVLSLLREYDTPIADFSGVMPYTEMQKMWDEDYPSGELRYYWKSAYLSDLSDEAIDALIEQNDKAPSVLSTLDIWHLGGAIDQYDSTTSAFGGRDAKFLIGIEANWEQPLNDDANIDWGRDTANALQPFSTSQRYLNFPGFFEEEALTKVMFGNNADRVDAIKSKYDPINLFRLR